MNKRRTGGGGLPRKLLAILVMAGMPLSVSIANDVYMEQIGDNVSVSVTQTGAGNLVNSGGVGSTDAAYIAGDNNVVTVNQIGAANTLDLTINGSGTGSTVTASTDGSSNIQTIACGTLLSASCNATTITSDIVGNNNQTTQILSGNAVSSVISVNGNYNNVSHTASGAGSHTGDITVVGSGTSGTPNAVTLVQTGAMTKHAAINSNGSNNNITVTQSD